MSGIAGARRAGLVVLVAGLLAAPAARADSSGHAHTMPGMSAAEHAQMEDGAGGGHDHAQTPAGAGSGHDHGEPAASGGHPVALVLGGFGAVNALVLAYAAVVRRRPDVRKRLHTLERVRSASPVRTVRAGGETP